MHIRAPRGRSPRTVHPPRVSLRRPTLFVVTVTAAAAVVSGFGLPASAHTRAVDLPRPTGTHSVVSADPATRPPVTRLVGIRTGRHASYDRVVFDLSGPTTGYRVEYAPRLVADGSGQPVPLAGRAVLRVQLSPADAHDSAGRPTCHGCRVLTPALPTLRQVKTAGDFEGYVTVGLGLRDRVGFRVFRLAHPNRIVVDVAHSKGAAARTSLSPALLLRPREFPAGWAPAWRTIYTGPLAHGDNAFPCARSRTPDPHPVDVLTRRVLLDIPGETGGYDGPGARQVVLASRSVAAAERAVATARAQLSHCRSAIEGESSSGRIIRERPGLYDGGFVAQVRMQSDDNVTDFHVAVGRVGKLVTAIAVDNYVRPVAEPAHIPSADNAVHSLRTALQRLDRG